MDRKDEESGAPALVERAFEQALDLREALEEMTDPKLEVLIDMILMELARRRDGPP